MKILILFLFVVTGNLFAQTYEMEIAESREQKQHDLKDTSQHILTLEETEQLISLDFYPVNRDFAVVATFSKNKGKRFKMPTSSTRTPVYRKYGEIEFEINGVSQKLNLYQNLELKDKRYKNYLFLPFRDSTSGNETYGAGRYLDLEIPVGDTILLDFNLCYNPYCAYSYRYSCPIPPEENTLRVAIKAGEKTPKIKEN